MGNTKGEYICYEKPLPSNEAMLQEGPICRGENSKEKANKIVAEGGPQLYVYGCTQCGGYHLTKNKGASGNVF